MRSDSLLEFSKPIFKSSALAISVKNVPAIAFVFGKIGDQKNGEAAGCVAPSANRFCRRQRLSAAGSASSLSLDVVLAQ